MEVREVANQATISAVMARPQGESLRESDKVLKIVDQHRHLLFLALFGAYLLGFNAQWRVERDSALYLTLARNISQGLGYTYRGIHHQLAYPGLPYIFAAVSRLLHTNSVVPLLVLMMLMGWAALGLTYRLFLLHADRPTAVMVTLGLGMTRLFYRYSFELLSDMPFLVAVLAFLVGFESILFARRRDPSHQPRWFDWLFLIGGLGMAISLRPVMLVLLGAIVVAVIWSALAGEFPRRWAMGIAVTLIVAAALFYWKIDTRHHHGSASVGGYEDFLLDAKFAKPMTLLRQIFRDNIPGLLESAAMKALFGAPLFVGMNTLLSLIVIALSFWLLGERKLWGVWALATVGMLCVFKPLDRYFLPVIPLLVYAWWQVLATLNRRFPWSDKLFLGLLIFGGTTNLLRLGQMIVFEQRRVPFIEHYRDGCYASLPQIGGLLQSQMGPHDWVLVEPRSARILTYVSDRNGIEKGDNVPLEATQPAFALEGFFDESRPVPGDTSHLSTLATELRKHHLKLGPQVGEPIQGPHGQQPWVLRRVVKAD